MYTIFKVIYGTIVTEEFGNKFPQVVEEWKKRAGGDAGETEWIIELYSGAASWSPMYIGVGLGEFDETMELIPVEHIRITPTQKEIELAEKALEYALSVAPPEARSELPSIRTYFLACTS